MPTFDETGSGGATLNSSAPFIAPGGIVRDTDFDTQVLCDKIHVVVRSVDPKIRPMPMTGHVFD